MTARKPAISSPADAILVTADNELRVVVRRQRPPGLRLACFDPHELRDATNLPSGELWLDLDELGSTELADLATVCFQSFPSNAEPRWEGGGNAILVRKPCSAAVVRRLWRAVKCEKQDVCVLASENEGVLPAWMNEFHRIGLRELCRLCVRQLPQRLGYADASLYLHDPETGVLSLIETTHRHPIDAAVSVAGDREHLMTEVARSGRLLQTCDADQERQQRSLAAPHLARYSDGACLIAPLMCDGQLWGLLNLSRRQPAGTDCPPRPEPIFDFLGRSLRYAREYEQAHLEARIDVLTGLYNQRWMKEALSKEIRRSERFNIPLSLIAADLDGLKAINDREGHPAGDCVLRHVARRISSVLRQFDSAARVGGDEFTILLPATALEGARQVARRILEAVRGDAALYRGVPLPIQASLGVAQWEPTWDGARLIETADQAMYLAKRQGRNQLICRERSAGAGGACLAPAASGGEDRAQSAAAERCCNERMRGARADNLRVKCDVDQPAAGH